MINNLKFINMKKYILILVAFIGFLVIPNSGSAQQLPVKYYGVSFICPTGWEVSSKEDEGDYQIITVEKKGFNSSGIVTITLLDEEYELKDLIQIYRNSIEEQSIYSNLKFYKQTGGTYGQYKGLVCKYTASVLYLPHKGSIYVFNTKGKSVCIIQQEAIEDSVMNKSGFEKLAESLTVN
jgi:hypothetical protein